MSVTEATSTVVVGRTGFGWLSGNGAPASGLGRNGDLYLDVDSGDAYVKAADAWTLEISLAGPAGTGAAIVTEARAPLAGDGTDGNYFLNTDTNEWHGPKAAGAWPAASADFTGATGATGTTGATGAAGVDGYKAPVSVAGTTDTLSAADHATTNHYTDAALVTVTIPTDATEDLPDGFWTLLFPEGAAGLTLDTTGITTPGNPNKTVAQGEALLVQKTGAADTWLVMGGTSS